MEADSGDRLVLRKTLDLDLLQIRNRMDDISKGIETNAIVDLNGVE
jgi:hypothetical protein